VFTLPSITNDGTYFALYQGEDYCSNDYIAVQFDEEAGTIQVVDP